MVENSNYVTRGGYMYVMLKIGLMGSFSIGLKYVMLKGTWQYHYK